MFIALIIATASILGGSALALLPTRRRQILGPIRTFGLTASVAVVLLHLLPEVYEAQGGSALIAFIAALVAPSALRPLMRALAHSASDQNAEWVTLRITYAGLLVHSVADGVALAAYSGHMHAGTAHYDVLLALSAHTIPVVAVMILTFRDFRGLRFALFGALGILLATSSGVLGAGLVSHAAVHGASAWVGAVVAGLLLHVVTHDLGGHAPERVVERALDLFAAGAGVGVGLLSGEAHSHLAEARGVGPSLGHALVVIALETAPMLLLGLFGAALLQTYGSRLPTRWLKSEGAFRDAIKGALVGLPLPLCSCKVLPISKRLEERHAGPALVVAFLLATPELGAETFALTVRFLGWKFAALRLFSGVVIAVFAAVVVGRVARTVHVRASESTDLEVDAHRPTSAWRRLLSSFDELLQHIGAWMVLGIIAAAFVEALVPPDVVSGIDSHWVEFGVVTVLTVPSYICAPSATPLAAVLIAKGISPGAVLVGLLLGPATNLAALMFLKGAYGLRATLLGVLAIVSSSWLLAFGVNAWFGPAIAAPMSIGGGAEYIWLSAPAAMLLFLLLLRSMWRAGTRGWLASMFHPHGRGPDAEADGHAHGHAHRHSPSYAGSN